VRRLRRRLLSKRSNHDGCSGEEFKGFH
jgi:hypothetical protein